MNTKIPGLRSTTVALIVAAILVYATRLYAQATTYAYQGNSYSTFVCNEGTYPCDSYPRCLEDLGGDPPIHAVCNPYSISGRISGSFTTSAPVAAGSGGVGANVIDFSFSDGVITWNPTNSSISVCVVTDSQGHISEGSLVALSGTGGVAYGGALNAWTGPPCSSDAVDGSGFEDTNCTPFHCTDGQYVLAEGENLSNPGTWSGGGSTPLRIVTISIPNTTSGTPYSTMVLATGGSGSGYTWSLSGLLPAGFTFASAGVLSSTGSPAASAGPYRFTVQVTDSARNTAVQPLTLVVLYSPANEQTDKPLGSCCETSGCASCADPITIGTGNVFEQVIDYQTAGANKLEFARYYNSQAFPGTFARSLGG